MMTTKWNVQLGDGFFYRTLGESVRRWRVTITGYDNGKWLALPN